MNFKCFYTGSGVVGPSLFCDYWTSTIQTNGDLKSCWTAADSPQTVSMKKDVAISLEINCVNSSTAVTPANTPWTLGPAAPAITIWYRKIKSRHKNNNGLNYYCYYQEWSLCFENILVFLRYITFVRLLAALLIDLKLLIIAWLLSRNFFNLSDLWGKFKNLVHRDQRHTVQSIKKKRINIIDNFSLAAIYEMNTAATYTRYFMYTSY